MKILLFIIVLIYSILNAQEKDTVDYKWTPSFLAGLNISQIAFSNWAKGGSNSLTWTVKGDFNLSYLHKNWLIKNQIIGEYGRTKLGEEAFRTNTNEIFLESVFALNLGWKVNPFFSATARTQLTDGYDYDISSELPISSFFDPVYLIQTVGFNYVDETKYTARIGLAIKETFTNKYRIYSDDPSTKEKIESFKLESGFESYTYSKFELARL